jgi:predicted adenine nucleotide alpha hydrolase (AANH) superfamily ATPase
MRILLHICCAPCALQPLADLREEGHEVMGLFFNPNVQPYTEYRRRLECVQDWAQTADLKLVVHDEYEPEEWFRRMAFREGRRCQLCHNQRLTRAAQVARRGGFDAFSSTLLYSIQQKHDSVQAAGQDASAEWGTRFLYRDWRPLWKAGVALSLELGLYRQQYCGCLFSERDRYLGHQRQAPGRKSAGRRQNP